MVGPDRVEMSFEGLQNPEISSFAEAFRLAVMGASWSLTDPLHLSLVCTALDGVATRLQYLPRPRPPDSFTPLHDRF